jgi:glyoxylate/hydroxypyruvate reductase A
MTILFATHYPDYVDVAKWVSTLNTALPGVAVDVWPEVRDDDAVRLIVGDFPPPGIGSRFRNLKAVMYIGAGVDAMLRAPDFPRHLPLVRSDDRAITFQVAQYVAWQILEHHRHGSAYRIQQRQKAWHPIPTDDTRALTVGLLGFGRIGRKSSEIMRALEFRVAAWSRKPKATEQGVTFMHGVRGLRDLVGESDYLVSTLPLTQETRGIIGRELLAAAKPGLYFINVGRGGQVVDSDLLEAIDAGQISGASLDVFNAEPLPPDHPYWEHPKVTVTPHVANFWVDGSLPQVVDLWHRLHDGRPLQNLVDPDAGY